MSIVFASTLNMLKANILNGVDPDASAGIEAINKEIEYLESQTYVLARYAQFAVLTGETYTIPAFGAAWLDLAVEHDSPHGNKERLQYVNVREHGGRRWLAATDGHRLHAHVTDLPIGVYLMVCNKLRHVDSKYPDWTAIVPCSALSVAVDEYATITDKHDIWNFAVWNILNGNLVKFDASRKPYKLNENYRLNERYFKEALSFGGDPVYALGEATVSQPKPYQRTMLITWPDAFAMIMPMIPE